MGHERRGILVNLIANSTILICPNDKRVLADVELAGPVFF